MAVSIHAPGRGATYTPMGGTCGDRVSIHAPGRGATLVIHGVLDLTEVSIHAPGRGATAIALTRIGRQTRFNSRTREGATGEDGRFYSLVWFQFTHPGGVRLPTSERFARPTMFQFTHPGGVRRVGVGYLLYGLRVSIHAPGRGATAYPPDLRASSTSFNSRTREGCDSCGRSL